MNLPFHPRVCVLILNWNGAMLLRRYLPSLLQHTPREVADIIVADNGSTDDSLQVLQEYDVQALSLSENYGFAGGYNRAIAHLDHEYICLLNSDVRVTDRWLQPLVAFLDTHTTVVSVQPKLLWDRHPDSYEYAGAQGGYMDRWGYPFCRGRVFDTLELDHGQYGQEPSSVFWTTGACMVVRRHAYIECGGLEGAFFAHQEEIDLCWRWINRGYDLYVVPESTVYHYGGASLSADNPRKTYLNFRNNLLMLHRNLPTPQRRHVIGVRTLLDAFAALVFILRGKCADARAVCRAWRDYRTMRADHDIDLTVDKHRGYQRLYRHTLLWRYHVCRERTFAQLQK